MRIQSIFLGIRYPMQIGTYVKIIQTIFSKPITITHYLGCFVITAMIFELLVVMAIVFIVTKIFYHVILVVLMYLAA